MSYERMQRKRCFWIILLPGLFVTGFAHGQTWQVQNLNLDGARAVLHAAEQMAQQLSAPSSLAVVDAAGDLILFEQMQGARPIGIDLLSAKPVRPHATGTPPRR
jgi:Haem-degrading